MTKRIPISKPYLWGEEKELLVQALDDAWISHKGPFVSMFEESFARTIGVKHAVAVNSGTSALHLALDIMGIGDGDEVLVPDFCMAAPVFAIHYCGAKPVLVDVDPFWTIDPDLIRAKITENTKAILVVHTYGNPANMGRILKIAKEYDLRVIEDCAEAIGGKYGNKQLGSLADISCFSLYANKIVTTGEGGILATENTGYYESACWKRNLCFGSSWSTWFQHKSVGYSYRFGNLQAALGLAQIRHLTEAVAFKRNIAEKYNRNFTRIQEIQVPNDPPWGRSVFWQYGILLMDTCRLTPEQLQLAMMDNGIETRPFFTPLHCQPFLESHLDSGDFPLSAKFASKGICLPTYVGMSDEDIETVVKTLSRNFR